MNRKRQIDKIRYQKNFDLIVIGGGASGLGTALDGALRGYKTALFELEDFAKGTSSRSTKLVHGGVRYLEQGNIKLVKESLRERGLLLKNASHLVGNLKFILPNPNLLSSFYYWTGLKIYDVLADNLSIGKTEFLNKEAVEKLTPGIKPEKIQSGILYHDGYFDDARLAINLMQSINENGGMAVNHMGVIGLDKDEEGKMTGVRVQDQFTGEILILNSKTIVNATGIFTDSIMNMDNPDHREFILPSQGVHLVVDKSFFPGEEALIIPKTKDDRVLFAVPWHDKVIIGTTDTEMKESSFEPKPLKEEVEFILETANEYLEKKIEKKNILSAFAGMRPLVSDGNSKNTGDISRSHKIIVSDSGMISIIGGKWTTYRKMAEDIIDKAIDINQLPKRECQTKDFPIHGYLPSEKSNKSEHLYIYGADIPAIKKLQSDNPSLYERIHPRYPQTYAEVLWAMEHEMAETLEDVLARRVRLLFLDARAAMECAESTAEFMANHLGKDENWVKNQTNAFKKLAENYLITED